MIQIYQLKRLNRQSITIRIRLLPTCYDHFSEHDKNAFVDYKDPKLSYNPAVTGSDGEKWLQAINKELEVMKRYDVWELVPKNKKIKQTIFTRWIFTVKINGTYCVDP